MDTPDRRRFLTSAAALAGAALCAPRLHAWTPAGGPRARTDVTAFLAAVTAGRLDEVRSRLAVDPGLAQAHDESDRSAVVLALLGGHGEVGAALVEHGAEVGLVEAVMLADWERAEALVAQDVDGLHAWHPVGGTVVYAAARAGHATFYQLQDLGADPDGNPRGRSGVTPAYGALECPSDVDALRGLVNLLSNGGHANAPQRGGDSLLHAAARRGDPACVRYLLRRGADPDARDARGRSPIDLARTHGKVAAVALLQDPGAVPRDDMTTRYAFDASGAPVQWPDLSDLSAEEQGAVTGPSHFDYDGLMVAMAGEPRRSFGRSSQNELAVEACAHTGNRTIMRYHLEHGVPQSLCTSLSVGDLGRAKALLAAHPAALRERGPHDFAPMWYSAIGGGSVEAAELLLDAGLEVDQESMGTTALHWAASRDHRDLMAFLVERGADPDAVGYKFDRNGQTPSQLARMRGRDGAADMLSELGAMG
jgi:cytohesin